ncbi:hypothetical protein PG985_008464 [Apiospora marii]|uniref:Uncharacterized protein n=1 Tax=Apiospora marii TaxID=335849 RepID=A0ABR1SSD6_9PEZI
MAPTSFSLSFMFLGTAGFVLLWGLMGINGTTGAMLNAAWTGKITGGPALKTRYTGIQSLDFALSILVAFFYGIMMEERPYLVILDIVGCVFVINMMTLVESRRPTASKWLRFPLGWQYLFNGFGLAVFLPLYSYIFAMNKSTTLPGRIPTPEAQSTPMTALWSLLLPIPLLVPPILATSPESVQNGLVLYFMTPLLFIIFHSTTCIFMSRGPSQCFKRPVQVSYQIVGIVSTGIHLGILAFAFFSANPDLSIAHLYYPDNRMVQQGQPDALMAGAYLFSQWDLIITNITALLLAISIDSGSSSVLIMIMVAAIGGPGAALALALIHQEDRLEKSRLRSD